MKAFLSKHQFIILWILGLIIVGAAAVLIIQLNGVYLPVSSVSPRSSAVSAAATPAAPHVSLTIQTNGKAHTLVVQWNDLPGGTTALNIFRSRTAATSSWELWKTVSVPDGQTASGNAQFGLTQNDLGYRYYVQAVGNNTSGSGGGGGGNGNGLNGTGNNVLWTSSSTTPIETTSTTSTSGNDTNSGQAGTPPSETSSSSPAQNSTTTTSTATTTAITGTTNSSTNTTTGSGGSPAPSGNPYYNPQVQVMGYGTAQGTFWVQHVNQSIEVGWQDLPSSTDDLIFSRAASSTGPWNKFLEQKNPGSTGSYSLQIVDGTLNEPYYYEMTAFQGAVSSATYGPIYLAPVGQ